MPTYLPAVRYGGPIWTVHGLCKALARRGHEVTVFTTNVDGPADSEVPLDRDVGLDGVRVRYFPSRHGRRLYWSPGMARALRESVSGFDLLHLHSIFLWPTWAAARAARAARRPYLLAPRGMLTKTLVRERGFLRKSAWIHLVERRNLEGAAAVHATSALEADEIRAFGFRLRRVLVVPNGVDVAPVTEAPVEAGVPVLLYLGRVSWKKGIDRLVEALAFVPEAVLVVAGGDDEGLTPRLQALASQRGVADRVRFVGPVYGTEKRRLLTSSSLFVLPSLGENFGHAVLEAMAHGLPVVVTPEVGLADEIAAAGAGGVVSGEPASLGPRLAGLLAAPDERRRMGERGRLLASERFSWDAVARALEVHMQALLTPEGQR